MKRPDGLTRDPWADGVEVRDRQDMEVDHEDDVTGTIYYRDKVEDTLFFMGEEGRVDA